jgi:hypothetical protein
MNRIKKHLITSLAAIMIVFVLGLPAASAFAVSPVSPVVNNMAASSSANQACTAINDAFGGSNCDSSNPDKAKSDLGQIISKIIDILSWVVGAISVLMLVIGGFRYIVSGGDSNSTAGAKNTILYALIGLAIVIFAQAIVIFVISNI